MSALDFGIQKTQRVETVEDVDVDVSDNFFGYDDTDTKDVKIQLSEDEMINYFFVNLRGGPLVKMNKSEIYKHYHRLLILCRSNQSTKEDMSHWMSPTITKDTFEQIKKSVVLVEGSMKMLSSFNHLRSTVCVDRENLTAIRKLGFVDLENDEIVLPLFELTERSVNGYLATWQSKNSLESVMHDHVVAKYYSSNKNGIVRSRMSTITADIDESNYWNNPYHCGMNMTDAFKSRTFRFKDSGEGVKVRVDGKNSGIKDPEAKQMIDKFMSTGGKSDYVDLHKVYKKEQFVDASSKATHSGKGYKLYRLDYELPQLTKEQITEFFRNLESGQELYDMFNSFVLSKSHWHLVLNNRDVLQIMKPVIKKFMPVFRYTMGYAWVSAYMEECIIKTHTKHDARYVFDINTASELPFFPFCPDELTLNPYLPILVDSKTLDSQNNCHSLAMIENYDNYGITNLEQFERKFNIFTTGRADMNIFDGIESDETGKWKHFAVSGSLIPACAQKKSPLVDIITTPDLTDDEKLNRFFDEYYPDSDVDVMCNKKSIFDFMDEANKMINIIKENLNKINGKDVSDTVTVEPTKSLMVVVTMKYIEQCLADEFGGVDYIVKNIDTDEVKEIFYEKYVTHKTKSNRKLRSYQRENKNENPLFNDFNHVVELDNMNVILTDYDISKKDCKEYDSDYYIYTDSINRDVSEDDNIMMLKISESIKFKVKSVHLNHTIEIFKTKYEEFFSCVARFHLPCVRGYYDGNNVLLTPSCVSALMTGVNMDYKYFAGVRDPIEIMNKYRFRGFSLLLTDAEKNYMAQYNSEINKWKGMFPVDPKSKQSVIEHFGAKTLSHPMFKPGAFMKGYPDEVYNIPDYKYVMNKDDLVNIYKQMCNYDPQACGVDLFKFKAVGDDGNIKPLNRWIIQAGYEILSGN